MKTSDTASFEKKKRRTKIIAVIGILALLLFAILIQKVDIPLLNAPIEDVAAITLWSDNENRGLATIFGGKESDLIVSIRTIGYIDTKDEFVESGFLKSDRNGALRFTVANRGNDTSSDWMVEAGLPTIDPYSYTSEMQQPLAPGDEKTFLLIFSDVSSQEKNGITVRVHADNDESLENNIASQIVSLET